MTHSYRLGVYVLDDHLDLFVMDDFGTLIPLEINSWQRALHYFF